MSAHEIDDVTRTCLSTLKFVESTHSPVHTSVHGFREFMLIVSLSSKFIHGHFNLHRHSTPTVPLYMSIDSSIGHIIKHTRYSLTMLPILRPNEAVAVSRQSRHSLFK